VTIACATEREWQALCAAMGRPAWPPIRASRRASDRRANEADVEREITHGRARGTAGDHPLLQAAGVAASLVSSATWKAIRN